MEEVPFSNREISEKFQNLDILFREKHDDTMIKMGEILTQAKATNGYVADLKKFREQTIGASKALSIVGIAVMAILGWALVQITSDNASIAALRVSVHLTK